MSLTDGRRNFLSRGASDPKDRPHCRSPRAGDEQLRRFQVVHDIVEEIDEREGS